MSDRRDDFLRRVRQAVDAGNRPGARSDIDSRRPLGYHRCNADLLRRFREEFTAVGGIFHQTSDGDSCVRILKDVINRHSANSVLVGGGALLESLQVVSRLREMKLKVFSADELYAESCRDAFFLADVGISGVDSLVAETGTVVLHSRPDQPRSLSLLPPVHVAVVERRQLVADLFDLFPSSNYEPSVTLASCITFITGPSKTGDIELRLVTGVHGPGEIHVVLIDR